MAERTFSEGLVLPDGRKVRVLGYADGSIRFRLDEAPYVLEECFLSGGSNDHAIIKLAPKNRRVVSSFDGSGDPMHRLQEWAAQIRDAVTEGMEEADTGPGRVVRRRTREGIKLGLDLILMQIDTLKAAEAAPETEEDDPEPDQNA